MVLYIVATPIGHLEDISGRALKTLEAVDAILCEDTRRSNGLLERYGIKKPLIAYHKFTEKKLLDGILRDLEEGRELALISDAGTPCINDPGSILIQGCIEKSIPFTAIPGPCSPIQALVLSGFDTTRFQCIGFLPKGPEKILKQALSYPGTTVAFESPARLMETLEIIQKLDEKRKLAVAREMTKTFEECRRGTAAELLSHYAAHPLKGEIVLVISEGETPEDLTLEELVAMLQDLHGLSLRDAVKEAAKLMKIPKRLVYKKFQTSN